ncbi:CheB methylesterase domain-containing protein [Aestuariicoccus sp. MJ-SS9]|uniref:CheB methylesterase domain-containing protein n=1 Tax=Aestuariicoccus sp. MJ-SS9 TaxID=3079855 RepID=UPI0029151BDF|nr:CheB methylesterase domain-containing protein [Aestuariicoccus sp. MJ-SS9]MDU8912386.1 CheB methylesterase domain-containing protein [Aestuariicoccus sp. MJ-SS9]
MTRVSVVLALQDAAINDRFSRGLSGVPGLRVVCRTRDLAATYAYVEEFAPDVVVIGNALAAKPEFEVMRALFATFDVRWLVIRDAPSTAQAQTAKSGLFEIDGAAAPDRLAETILAVARSERRGQPAAPKRPATAAFDDSLILIGASTGGIDALMTVLRHFPPNCPPVLIVQHTGAGFGPSLAGLLDRQCPARVRLAADGQPIETGTVALAAGCKAHIQLADGDGKRLRLVPGAPVSGHMPSIDMLFRSAVPVARRCIAVQLTGMGRDGAAGMRQLFDAGARTLAQDEATSTVYGMPRAAVELGGVQQSVALPDMGQAILAACKSRKSLERG